MGVPFSRQAVDDTFANAKDYNEWTVTDAETIGMFVIRCEPLEVAMKVSCNDIPSYDPSLGEMDSTIAVRSITLSDVIHAFPGLLVYAFVGTEIVQIGIEAAAVSVQYSWDKFLD